jgi:hypothetical protein
MLDPIEKKHLVNFLVQVDDIDPDNVTTLEVSILIRGAKHMAKRLLQLHNEAIERNIDLLYAASQMRKEN